MPQKTMILPVRLTIDELAARHEELTKVIDDRDGHVSATKTAAGKAKIRLNQFEADIQRLKRICLDHAEGRPVEVKEQRNFDRCTIDTIRLDTWEVVMSRGITEHERNIELFPTPSPAPPETGAEPERAKEGGEEAPAAEAAPDAAGALPEAVAEEAPEEPTPAVTSVGSAN